MTADTLVDRDVFFGNLARARIGSRGPFRRRQMPQHRAHLIERPFQVDRRRPRRDQRFVGTIQRGIRTVGPHRQRHAIGRGRADQRRAAHQHRADRVSRGIAVRQPRHDKVVRQFPLVDRADRPAVRLEPDTAKMLAVDLHDVPIDTLQSDSTEVESNCSGIFLFEHGLFGKPVSTFPDHAPNLTRAKPAPPPHRASSKAPDRALPER